ncbi:DUF7289 family protein [Methanolobus halotolerans]|uniref:Uncharacterized protein n=1 Tax=Methanolobus halotolerans TaxID=2052935 RepID=A0A4E0PX00_9EURY|nr:hypothetical protein [Methanolobus halotolerans]TGC07305.1 hypothetical protein CUN85_11670 [Methanolobus halotolerans]
MKKKITRSEDAVSEMVDFSIILSIMLLATGIVVVAGVPMLENTQNTQHTENIRQGFEVLALNMNKVVQGNAPSQSVEMKMNGGSLAVAGDNYIAVDLTVWNSSANASEIQSAVGSRIKMIKNSYQGNTVSYENTGVWAKYGNGQAVIVSEPRFTYANNVLVIPFAKINGRDHLSGSGLVRVTADGGRRNVDSYENVSQVNISVTSDYFEAWGRYLNESMQMSIVAVDSTNKTINASKEYIPNIDVYVTSSPITVTIN